MRRLPLRFDPDMEEAAKLWFLGCVNCVRDNLGGIWYRYGEFVQERTGLSVRLVTYP